MNTSDSNVRPFAKRLRHNPAQEPAAAPVATWDVAHLIDPLESQGWFFEAVAGKPHENIAVSLWTHHANLRSATEKLAAYITTRWLAPDGRPLIDVAIERAALRAQDAIDRGEAFEGRLVGVYLFGLLSIVGEIARMAVVGVDADGVTQRWPYFAAPLREWAVKAKIQSLALQPLLIAPTEVMLSGLRMHMIARLANPVDAGYLAKHAANG
jgi:hypothetical protein